MTSVPEKVCGRCGLPKPASLDFFRPMKSGKYGLQGICIPCDRVRKKEQYDAAKKSPEFCERKNARARNLFKNPEQKAKKREYFLRHKDRIRARDTTPEKMAQRREREKAKRRAAPEITRAKDLRQRRKNPEKRRELARRAKARRKAAPGKHTRADIRKQMAAQSGKCYWCRTPLTGYFEVDHIIPLNQGGTNGPENICCACRDCNRQKSDKTPWEFAGRLF